VLLFAPACLVLFAGDPNPPDLPLINRLDELVQLRFKTPIPGAPGMSRIVAPSSMGGQFQPHRPNERDFIPENAMEWEVIGKLEESGVHVGLSVFGTEVVTATAQALDYRALKGPGAVTRGTPRPAWYPEHSKMSATPADALPDWNAVYPLARRAMQRFQSGGAGFESRLESWDIAARPVAAGKRCAMCHRANQPSGGVLYAFRRSGR
jgi:hypothetical protein